MELIIQKAVELGAYRVVPVSMKRSVVKLDAKKADAKRKRWNAVSESAAKQSKRSLIPEVAPLMTYKEAVKEAAGYDMVLLPYESADGIRKTGGLLASVKPGTDIAVFIGPEAVLRRRSRTCQGKRGGDRNAWKENFADGDGRLVYAVGTDAAVGSVIEKLQRR